MANPINYILDVPDPLENVLRGFEAGAAIRRQPLIEQREAEDRERLSVVQGQQDTLFGQQQTQFAQGQEDRGRVLAEAARQKAEAQKMQADIAELNDNPNATAADYARIVTTYPQIASQVRQGWELLDTANKESTLRGLGEVYAAVNSDNVPVAESLLVDRMEALRNSGRTDEADKTEAMLEILRADPEAAKTSIGIAIKALGGSQYNDLLDTAPTVQTSTVYGDGTVLKVMKDGSTVVTNPAGDVVTGADAAQTIAAANAAEVAQRSNIKGGERTEVLKADIGLGGQVEKVKDLGKLAAELTGENLASYNKVRTNIANYGQAIDALDRGAKTGAIQKYVPNITAASIELGNVRSRLGLDIIGAATFGALSKGELDLALSTGLPDDMDEPELRDWLSRKRDAQSKMAVELYNAAIFLSDPQNTVQDYLGTIQAPQVADDVPEDQGAPDALSGAQSLMKIFGGAN